MTLFKKWEEYIQNWKALKPSGKGCCFHILQNNASWFRDSLLQAFLKIPRTFKFWKTNLWWHPRDAITSRHRRPIFLKTADNTPGLSAVFWAFHYIIIP